MTSTLPQTAPQPNGDTSPQLNDSTLLPITGAEFVLVRDLLKRSLDEHMSRVRDNNLGLTVLDGVVARFAQDVNQQQIANALASVSKEAA